MKNNVCALSLVILTCSSAWAAEQKTTPVAKKSFLERLCACGSQDVVVEKIQDPRAFSNEYVNCGSENHPIYFVPFPIPSKTHKKTADAQVTNWETLKAHYPFNAKLLKNNINFIAKPKKEFKSNLCFWGGVTAAVYFVYEFSKFRLNLPPEPYEFKKTN